MCEASKIIILKKGDMISEEEVFVLKKSSEILSEIRERKVKWKKVNWIGNKPEYEWFVLGFSSDICMEGEDIPAILLLHMGEEKDYQEMDQFNVAPMQNFAFSEKGCKKYGSACKSMYDPFSFLK